MLVTLWPSCHVVVVTVVNFDALLAVSVAHPCCLEGLFHTATWISQHALEQ